jgi:single-stranded-DNA-specific exonuclease
LFFKEIDKVAKITKALLKEKNVKIVSHYDADGLTSASIIIKALTREGANFKIRVIKQLTETEIKRLDVTEDDFLIFVDLGSGQINNLRGMLEKTQILILDHHDPIRKEHMNLFHINPLIFGEEEISGAMVTYLFAKALNKQNTDLIDLAVVGAIGDVMDNNWKLEGLGRKILEEAEMLGKVTISQGLRLYGRNTRPVFKSIEYSSDITIPGITGSESNAVQFLSELGIELKEGEKWRRLKDLSEEEQKKLASAIIVERLNHGLDNAEDIFGEIYTLVGRPEDLQNVREFATLINACGRTGRFEVAVRLCLGDLTAIRDSWDIINDYKRMISSGMTWLRSGNLDERERVVVIDGGTRIDDAIIGTLSSISLSSGLVDVKKIILGFADAGDGKLKVSARMSRHISFNLRDIIVESAHAVEGEAGGHQFAAGGMIDADKKEEFIKAVENKLSKLTKS